MNRLMGVSGMQYLQAKFWQDDADLGRLRMPGDIGSDGGVVILAQIARMAERAEQPLTVNINCSSGDARCWRIAAALEAYPLTVTTVVERAAISAGLIIAVAGSKRIARPGAQFGFHGNMNRYDAESPNDEGRARYFADRTTAGYEFWCQKALSDEVYTFDAEEALALGVVHEISDTQTLTLTG